MTVQSELQKAIAAAEAAKGTYTSFALSVEDKSAKAMFRSMARDMDHHIVQLTSRFQAITAHQILVDKQ
jgi:rubrerythrin